MVITKRFQVPSKGGADIIDITPHVEEAVQASGLRAGTVTVFVAHTTAGITIIEAESGALEDFKAVWDRIAPSGMAYQHNIRTNDDNAHSHLRASLLGASLVVPFADGKLTLGIWQRIILVDFDSRARKRDMVLQIMGE
ncbi:MAG: YjbQ family protein [Chloroflexi bacterium]|nr:YjbQ family protein [Chloroflexota bacterium]